MSEFKCAIEAAGRRGAKRCDKQCQSCLQKFLKRNDDRPMTSCETASGRYFDFADPRATTITLDDVAHHLSVNCRFGGACSNLETGDPVLYSVAEHALRVCDLVIEWGRDDLALAALHHDSHEYMWGDWPTPLKRLLRAHGIDLLGEMVEVTDDAIGERFGIDPIMFHDPLVKSADTTLLYREAATFKVSQGIGPHWGRTEVAKPLYGDRMTPAFAKKAFIARHIRLGGK